MGSNLPLLNRRRRSGGFSPALLFASGEQGAVFDANLLTTLFQSTTGVTPVTAPGQTTALALSTTPGLVLGPELVTNGTFATDTDWTKGGTWTISSGVASVGGTSGSLTQAISLSGVSYYQVTYTVSSVSSGNVKIQFQGGSAVVGVLRTSAGTYTELLLGGAGNNTLAVVSGGTTPNATIDNISVKELPGFHATQATAGARPTYRNPSGVPYLEDDGGDSLNWPAPAGTYTVARVNSAGTVTIQTAQALSGATDMLLDAQTTAYVAVNRALSGSETELLTSWLRGRAGL